VYAGLVRLEIYIGPKDTGELFLRAHSVLAQIMLLSKMFSEVVVRTVILMQAIRVAEMTIEMIASQVPIQLVVVHVTLIAKLAERMTLVALVVDVAFPSVHGQARPGVTTSLV